MAATNSSVFRFILAVKAAYRFYFVAQKRLQQNAWGVRFVEQYASCETPGSFACNVT